MLVVRATLAMQARTSRTPTDGDIEDAFRDLTKGTHPGKGKRCLGDAALIAGGVLLPLWDTSPIFTLTGVFVCVLGLYIREFSG